MQNASWDGELDLDGGEDFNIFQEDSTYQITVFPESSDFNSELSEAATLCIPVEPEHLYRQPADAPGAELVMAPDRQPRVCHDPSLDCNKLHSPSLTQRVELRTHSLGDRSEEPTAHAPETSREAVMAVETDHSNSAASLAVMLAGGSRPATAREGQQ
eukprot:722174-Hanusia_phi.AAC.2